MKRRIGTGLLAVLMLAAMAVPALAVDGPSEPGIYLLTPESAVGGSLSLYFFAKDADTANNANAIEAGTNRFYANAEKIKVISNAQDNAFYLIIAQNDTQVPTEGNIEYIDQTTGTSNTATFTVYPKNLVSGTTYYIYLSSSADATGNERTPIASFKYYQPYILGDVDKDDIISSNDALYVLQAVAQLRTLDETSRLAADADRDGIISSNDALYILQAVAQLRIL